MLSPFSGSFQACLFFFFFDKHLLYNTKSEQKPLLVIGFQLMTDCISDKSDNRSSTKPDAKHLVCKFVFFSFVYILN